MAVALEVMEEWAALEVVEEWVALEAVEKWAALEAVEEWVAPEATEEWMARIPVDICHRLRQEDLVTEDTEDRIMVEDA